MRFAGMSLKTAGKGQDIFRDAAEKFPGHLLLLVRTRTPPLVLIGVRRYLLVPVKGAHCLVVTRAANCLSAVDSDALNLRDLHEITQPTDTGLSPTMEAPPPGILRRYLIISHRLSLSGDIRSGGGGGDI